MNNNKTEIFTSRTSKLVSETMDLVSEIDEHFFYDRSRSYIAHKILEEWAKKELIKIEQF